MKASNALAYKEWSVLCRQLHEGDGVLSLVKAFDSDEREFALLPVYSGQDPGAMKPHVWMSWRHELKAPLTGHVYVRDYAIVSGVFHVTDLDDLKACDTEHGLAWPELERRFGEGNEPGLDALVLRVYFLPRSYRMVDREELEKKEGRVLTLPEAISTEGAVPAVEEEDFQRRLRLVRSALGRDASQAA